MLIPRRTVRTSQPQHPVGIDRSNPITRGLAHHLSGIPGGVRNAVTGAISAHTGTPSIETTGKGRLTVYGAGSSTSIPNVTIGSSQEYTVSFLLRCDSLSHTAYPEILGINGWAGFNCHTQGDGVLYIGTDAGARIATSAGYISTADGLLLIHHVKSPSGQRLFKNGALTHSSGVNVSNTFGNATVAPNQAWRGIIDHISVSARAFSDAEVKAHAERFWQIFEDEEDYLFIPAVGGGGALALDAASGSFALTGVAATLAKHGLLSASAGSYAISGQASTLAAHRKLNAASGSYILTGASAGLTKHLLVNAAPGSVTISAIDATLVYTPYSQTPVLNAEAGTIGLSGLAASLSAHRVINAGNGSVSLSGASAELLYTALERSLNAGAGSVTVTGAAADLVYTGLNGLTLTPADIDAIAAAVLAALNATTGTRTVGQHLQIQTAVLAGNETGAGTTHVTFTDGTAVVEADVPLPGAIGNRTNVTTSV